MCAPDTFDGVKVEIIESSCAHGADIGDKDEDEDLVGDVGDLVMPPLT